MGSAGGYSPGMVRGEPRKTIGLCQSRRRKMGEFVDFPTFDERSWHEIEGAIRRALLEGGLHAAGVDWICEDMKPRYLAINSGLISMSRTPPGRQYAR